MLRRQLLFVEDNRSVRRSLGRLVDQFAFETLAVGSLDAARKALAKGAQPAASIIDVHLPDGSGLELARHVRASYPDVAVLILTGDDTDDVVHAAQTMGALYGMKRRASASVMAFLRMLPHSLVTDVVADYADRNQVPGREREMLTHLLEGTPRRDIHTAMGVSHETARTYVRRLLRRVGAPRLETILCELRAAVEEERRRRVSAFTTAPAT